MTYNPRTIPEGAEMTLHSIMKQSIGSPSYSAVAVLGVSIHKDNLVTPTRRRAFDHDYPADWEFDPKSGAVLWVEDDIPILSDDFMVCGDHEGIFAYSEGTDGDHLIIGRGVTTESSIFRATAGEHKRMEVDVTDADAIDSVRHGLQALLGDRYHESDFGIWVVQSCSY